MYRVKMITKIFFFPILNIPCCEQFQDLRGIWSHMTLKGIVYARFEDFGIFLYISKVLLKFSCTENYG